MGRKKGGNKGGDKTNGARKATFGGFFWGVCLLTSVTIVAAVATHGRLPSVLNNLGLKLDQPRHENKRFTNLSAFYPFYLQEHSDPTCRLLHFIGTSFSYLFMMYLNPKILLSTGLAVSVSFMLCELTAFLPNGAVEAVAMIGIYLFMNKQLSHRFGWEPIIAGYAFAWVGHFVFEQNKPATFIYPSYSFVSDLLMMRDILLGKLNCF